MAEFLIALFLGFLIACIMGAAAWLYLWSKGK